MRVKYFPIRFQAEFHGQVGDRAGSGQTIDDVMGLGLVHLDFTPQTTYFRDGEGRLTEIEHEFAKTIMRRGQPYTVAHVDGKLSLHGQESDEVGQPPRYYWTINVERCEFDAQETDA
jgi:hypothetical protein